MGKNMSRDSLPFITHIILFGRKLHDAGIDVNPANLIDLSRSLQYIDIASRRDFYTAALATLIINREDMELFTLLFNEYWDAFEMPEEPADPEKKTGEGAADSPDTRQQRQRADGENADDGNEDDAESEQTGYSSQELLAQKDIDSMTDEELEQARKIIAELIAILANRRSRRFKPAKSGAQLDFRKIFRRSMPYGEYCLKLAHRTPPAEEKQAHPVL